MDLISRPILASGMQTIGSTNLHTIQGGDNDVAGAVARATLSASTHISLQMA